MLSIIIPAYNEEKYIEMTLRSIKEQKFKDYEIIVVCNGCSDNTHDIAKKYTDKVFNLKEKNVPNARNFGANAAKGDLLVFLDADTYFINENALDILISKKRHSIGTCKFLPNKNNLKHKSFSLIKNFVCYFGMQNGILICEKELFNKVKGYDKSTCPMENSNLINRAKKYAKFQIFPKLVVTSMRRHEKLGYIKYSTYWIKKFFFNSPDDYEAIR